MQVAPWPKCSETKNIIVTYSNVTFKLIIYIFEILVSGFVLY